MKGAAIPYSEAERQFVSDNRTLTMVELHAAFVDKFGRDDVSAVNLNAFRKRQGWRTGRTGRFDKGAESWNKGKRHPSHPNSAKHVFRKGHLPHNTKFSGHERVSKDGYVEISIDEVNPHTGFDRRYVLKHLWLWEQQRGSLAPGLCLKCLDGDKTNTDPSNWTVVPRALLPRLNGRYGRGYDAAAAEIKPTIMAVAQLEHAVRERARGGAASARPPRPAGRKRKVEL